MIKRSFFNKVMPKTDLISSQVVEVFDPYVSEHLVQLNGIARIGIEVCNYTHKRSHIAKSVRKKEVDIHALIVRSVNFVPKLSEIVN